jgi:hypothetical protein
MKVIDNFMNNDVVVALEKHFLEVPHYYGHFSIDSGDKFYATDMDLRNPLVMCVSEKIKKTVDYKLNFLRQYINVQHKDMNGSFHSDDGQITFLLMSSKTLKPGSGQFQIKVNNNDNDIQSVDFIQNRLVMFDASWQHRGMAPLESNTPRITLAFKTEIVK